MIITVPTGKCPLNVIAEIGEDLKGALILLDDTVLKALAESANVKRHGIHKNCCVCYSFETYFWEASKNRPETTIKVSDYRCRKGWHRVLRIEGIVCTHEPYSPKRYIKIKMA